MSSCRYETNNKKLFQMKNFPNVLVQSISGDKIGTIFIIGKLFRLPQKENENWFRLKNY